jgi:HKD family nuclease
MKPYDEFLSLRAGSIDAFLALTYSVDLAWFERTLLPALRGAGARHIAVLADADELSKCLVAKYQFISAAGLEYLVIPMRGRGAFHPKAYIAAGSKHTRVFVGSGNLTTAGFGRNLEIFSRFETGQAVTTSVLAELRGYVDDQVRRYGIDNGPLQPYLDAAFGRETKPLMAPEVLLDGPACWKLFSSLRVDELTILSPFFDGEAKAVRSLAKACGASKVRVITDLRSTTLTRNAALTLQAEAVSLDVLDAEPRALHAKVVLARTESDEYLAMAGSINASNAAWHGTNAELGVILHGESAQQVRKLLSELSLRPLVEADLKHLREHPESKDALTTVNLQAAERDTQRTIWVRGIESGTIQVLGPGIDFTSAVESTGPGEARLALPAHVRTGVPLVVRTLEDTLFGAAVPVMDPFALQEATRPRSGLADAFRRAHQGNFEGTDLEKLFALLADVWRRRASDAPIERGSPKDGSSRRPGDNVVVLPPLADVQPTKGGGPALSLPMIDLLLFGGGDSDTPEESEGDPADPPHRGSAASRSASTRASDMERIVKYLRAAESDYRSLLAEIEDTDSRLASTFLDDLLVLSGMLHCALGKGIPPREFRLRLGILLRELIGSNGAHLVRAFARIPEDERLQWHERVPVLQVLLLNLYNIELCLHGPLDGPYRTTLWLRHVLPVVPTSSIDAAVKALEADLSRLQKGSLWAASRLSGDRSEYLPLPDYARVVVADARSYVSLDQWLTAHGWPEITKLVLEEGEQDTIVQRTVQNSLALGFAECDERLNIRSARPPTIVWLRHDPMSVPTPRDELEVAMTRGSPSAALRSGQMVSWLAKAAGSGFARALERLTKLDSDD